MLPLGHLKPKTARTLYKPLTKTHVLIFDVMLWMPIVQETVYLYLLKQGYDVQQDKIEMMPIEQIGLFYTLGQLAEEYSVPDHWKPVINLPDDVQLEITCKDNVTCAKLESTMKNQPEMFRSFEIQFRMLSEESSGRSIVITGQDITTGTMWTQLKNMVGAKGDDR